MHVKGYGARGERGVFLFGFRFRGPLNRRVGKAVAMISVESSGLNLFGKNFNIFQFFF
jgi:hypothetical protein